MLERWKHVRCVQLDDTDRLICNMTLFGQVMTLTWGQIFKMTFQGQQIVHSTRLDERNTMLAKVMSWRFWVKSYWRKNVFRKNGYFWSFCPLEAKPLTWGQIWEHYSERSVKGLSNALFRGAVALSVPEIAVGSFQNVEIVNILPLVTSGDLTFDLTQKMTEVFSSLFLTLFRLPLTACRYVAQEPS